MHRDLHLGIGTRVINTKTGRLGKVAEPHYMTKPYHYEICIQYDGAEGTWCDDRQDIEYQGNGSYEAAFKRWGHDKEAAGGT